MARPKKQPPRALNRAQRDRFDALGPGLGDIAAGLARKGVDPDRLFHGISEAFIAAFLLGSDARRDVRLSQDARREAQGALDAGLSGMELLATALNVLHKPGPGTSPAGTSPLQEAVSKTLELLWAVKHAQSVRPEEEPLAFYQGMAAYSALLLQLRRPTRRGGRPSASFDLAKSQCTALRDAGVTSQDDRLQILEILASLLTTLKNPT